MLQRIHFVIGVLAVGAAAAVAAVPGLLSYQGKLLDGGGVPVPDGLYTMEFRFYDACVDGRLLLTDRHPAVPLRSGLYAVSLGAGNLTPGVESDLSAVFARHATVCLGVRVNDDDEMSPRQPILSAGYALRAAVADDTLSGTVDADSDVIWTGRHEFTTDLTLADAFSIKWPHGTGAAPQATGFRITKFVGDPPGQSLHPDGELDEQFMVCYNCADGGTQREDLAQHGWNQKIEATYWNAVADREQLEVNWNYLSPAGAVHRPFGFVFAVTGHCSDDGSVCADDASCGSGRCDGIHEADFTWVSDPRGVCANDHHTDCTVDADCGGSECLITKRTVIDKDGQIWSWGGLTVPKLYAGPLSGTGNVAVRINADIEPTDQGATVRGVFAQLDFNGLAAPDAALTSAYGMTSQVWLTGDTPGRDIVQEATAFSATIAVTQTGGAGDDGEPPTVDAAHGLTWRLVPSGRNAVIRESTGILLRTPALFDAVAPIDVRRHHGIVVQDQRGVGTLEGEALLIDPQSGGPARGNVRFAGGSWNDGHLVFDTLHLWADPGDDLLRVKRGAPGAPDDGRPIHAPLGTGPSWGVTYWGDSSDAATNTGDEVCALAGLRCRETWDMNASSSRNCTTSSHATGRFLAFCY